MRKRTKYLILPLLASLFIIGVLYFLYYFTPRDIESIDLEELDNENINLSKDDYIEDFDFAYQTLEKYYPYFKINEEIYGVDWLSNKETYRNYVAQATNDVDFFQRMNDVLLDLNNGHTHLVDKDQALYFYLTYYPMPRFDWRNDIANIYEKERVRSRYGINNESLRYYIENHYTNFEENMLDPTYELGGENFLASGSFIGEEMVEPENISTASLIDGKLSYIRIRKMLSPDQAGSDEIILDSFLDEIKDYPYLIIDIRGNTGGDSRYWKDFFLPKIIGRTYKTTNYSFLKKGDLNKKVVIQEGYHANVKKFLKESDFSDDIKKFLSGFDYYNNEDLIVDPENDSINFKGDIYLLVDQDVYSSAEMFASFAKETDLAKLVGERTAGDGIGSDPMQIDLPNTGYVLRFSKNMGLTESGSINELDKTTPHIEVDPYDFEDELLDQKAIQAVLKDAGLD